MSNLSPKQIQEVVVEMSDIANKIVQINILDDSDCQSFYYLSGKSKIYKEVIDSYRQTSSHKTGGLSCVIENLYNVLMFLCAKKLAEVREYLQRTRI